MKKIVQAALLFTAAALLFGVVTAAAQTLEALQLSAWENREIVKRYQADLDIRMERIKEARGEFLPSLDLDYTLNRLNHDTAVGENRKNDTFTGGASWNVFAGVIDFIRCIH